MRNNVKSEHIAISQKSNNTYWKLCVIPVMNNYCILLTIKLFSSLIKGKLFLIYACLFNKHHKFYPSIFYLHTPRIKCFIQPIDVHVWSPSENSSWDIFRLWQYLPFHPLHNGSKVYLNLLVLYNSMTSDFPYPYSIYLTSSTIKFYPNILSIYF